jgi:hypothetical protein
MTDEEFDRLMERAASPNLIPGVYNYCDRRCERCRFSERCLSHLESRQAEAAPEEDSLATATTRSIGRAFELVHMIAKRQGFDLSSTPVEAAEYERAHDERDRRAMADPVVALSRHYVMTAFPITRALWPVVMPRGDTKVLDALETIECLSSSISAKLYRAVSGTLEPDFDASEIQSDANGSAKIARLLIAETRAAWQVLMEVGRATADGVPARLANMLDQIDSAVAVRFPRAMEFVRPGFDTEAATAHEDLDPALAVAPHGHA